MLHNTIGASFATFLVLPIFLQLLRSALYQFLLFWLHLVYFFLLKDLQVFIFSFRYDFVSVREGGTTEAPLVGRYCGHSLPPSHLSTGNRLLIRFKSDHSVSHEGFRVSYKTGKRKQMTAKFSHTKIDSAQNYGQQV